MSNGYLRTVEKDAQIATKRAQLDKTILENAALADEIKKIKTDPKFQKNLVREHLGAISVDEFLILFASDLDSKTK